MTFNLSTWRPPHFQRASLPDDLLARLRALWPTVRDAGIGIASFEQWESGFLRDLLPAREIACWEWMVRRYKRYVTSDMSPGERKKLMGKFLHESMERDPIIMYRPKQNPK